MKKILLVCLLFYLIPNYPQGKDVWTTFEDTTSGLFGYKDYNGNIKIEAKYLGFMIAQNFSDIVAVMEENNSNYYLLKNGKIVGRDSVYLFDNSFDCESEGFIRFRDPKTYKVGIFDGNGKVVVPSEYDEISKMINGIAVALKDAKKKFPNNNSTEEHWKWIRGTKYLIDKNNNILINVFPSELNLDFHSLEVSESPSKDIDRESFKANDGKYYSFINNEKLFENWLTNDFLADLTKVGILRNSYQSIIYWTDDNGWVSMDSKKFISNNYALLSEKIPKLNIDSSNYFFVIENNLILTPNLENEFEKYFDNCGQLKSNQFPAFDLIINHKIEEDFYQDHLTFFKTEKGFKLLNISFPNVQME